MKEKTRYILYLMLVVLIMFGTLLIAGSCHEEVHRKINKDYDINSTSYIDWKTLRPTTKITQEVNFTSLPKEFFLAHEMNDVIAYNLQPLLLIIIILLTFSLICLIEIEGKLFARAKKTQI